MNERIRQLAEKAEKTVKSQYPNDEMNIGVARMMTVFAELIVRECAGRVDNILREKKDGGGTMGDDIREHFGVEE